MSRYRVFFAWINFVALVGILIVIVSASIYELFVHNNQTIVILNILLMLIIGIIYFGIAKIIDLDFKNMFKKRVKVIEEKDFFIIKKG